MCYQLLVNYFGLREYLTALCGFSSVHFSRSVVSDSLWPHETQHPGLAVHHQFPESTQTYVRCVSDAIQPSHPLSPPSPPALNLPQHQGLFKWVSSSHQVAKILEVSASTSVPPVNTQNWSPLRWTGWISLQSKGLSRVFSNTTVQKHQFFCAQLSLKSNSQGCEIFVPQLQPSGVKTWSPNHWLFCLVIKSYPLCPALCDPMNGNPPGFSVHGISQARILEWVAISFSRRFSPPKDQTQVPCIDKWILYSRATWSPKTKPLDHQGIPLKD